MADPTSPAPACAILPFTLDPTRLHAKATNALQRCLLELFANGTNYGAAVCQLATAHNAISALAIIDIARPERTQASNDAERAAGAAPMTEPANAPTAAPAQPGPKAQRETLALRRKPSAHPMPADKRKAYCARMTEVLNRYLSADELGDLAYLLEDFTRRITTGRYTPGLTVSAYDAFARILLITECPRRLKFDPPCRSNIDPGRVAAG